ncbi:MAG: hypothetical protein ABJO09_04345 [Hyphomicrobiales bacterium]|uniref:hypothetical protein n=1 Tax=Nisaea sp. TaxID=2024842 RepID=UPI003273EE37
MADLTSTTQYGRRAAVFGLAATGIYLVMINITLEHLQLLSGLRPFDMRPGGYSSEKAYALLDALGGDGRQYYLTRQIPLDLIYPAFMALTLVSFLKWLASQGVNRVLTQIGAWLSVGAALADYLENAGICTLILNWPAPQAGLVYAASAASIAKAVLTTLAVLTTTIGLTIWLYRRIRDWLKRSLHG